MELPSKKIQRPTIKIMFNSLIINLLMSFTPIRIRTINFKIAYKIIIKINRYTFKMRTIKSICLNIGMLVEVNHMIRERLTSSRVPYIKIMKASTRLCQSSKSFLKLKK